MIYALVSSCAICIWKYLRPTFGISVEERIVFSAMFVVSFPVDRSKARLTKKNMTGNTWLSKGKGKDQNEARFNPNSVVWNKKESVWVWEAWRRVEIDFRNETLGQDTIQQKQWKAMIFHHFFLTLFLSSFIVYVILLD